MSINNIERTPSIRSVSRMSPAATHSSSDIIQKKPWGPSETKNGHIFKLTRQVSDDFSRPESRGDEKLAIDATPARAAYINQRQKQSSLATQSSPTFDTAAYLPVNKLSRQTSQQNLNFRIKSHVDLPKTGLKLRQETQVLNSRALFQYAKSEVQARPNRKRKLAEQPATNIRDIMIRDINGITGAESLENQELMPITENITEIDRKLYNQTFKNFGRLQEYQEFYKTKPNLYTKLSDASQAFNTLPKQLGLMRYKQNTVQAVTGSRFYVNLLAEGLSAPTYKDLKILKLSGNNLTSIDIQKVCSKMPHSTTSLDLQDNKLCSDVGICLSEYMDLKTSRLQVLNLENNMLHSKGINTILLQIEQNKLLKILNLSRNNLTDHCVESLAKVIQRTSTLFELYLHYNFLMNMGPFFKALTKNTTLKVLDLSFNRLNCAVDISVMLGKPHPELVHMDLSYNRLSATELQIIQKQLIFNDVMYGLHIEGNCEGYYINSRGFIVSKNEPHLAATQDMKKLPSHNKLDSLHQPPEIDEQALSNQEMERKVQQAYNDQHSPQLHRRIQGVANLGIRKEDAAVQDSCWICEGWNEMTFTWTPGVSGARNDGPMFLHLDCDNFRPMIMHRQDGQYVLDRMCPPNKNVEYFFSNPIEDLQTFARDQKTQETQPHSKIRNFGVSLIYSDGTTVESKPMGVVNVKKTGPAQAIIDPIRHYVSKTTCKPREPEEICEIDKSKALQRRWCIENSIFKDYDPDNQIRMNECLEFDLSCMKIGQYLTEDFALKTVLQNRYAQFLQLYYFYTSFSPNYSFPRVNQTSVQEFIEQSNILQRGLTKQVDIDICYISSHVLRRKDEFIFTEDKCLVRHQFLEFMIRLARESYVKHHIVPNIAEAIEMMITEHTQHLPPSQEWRDERYWIQLIDLTLRHKMPIIKAIFNASKSPRNQFLTPEEFIDLLKNCDLISNVFTEQEAYMIYQQSTMTQIDTLTKHRHCQMNVLEFCEAIARVAEKLSPASPAYKEKGLKLSQRRVLPLFVKLEGMIFIMYHLLDLKSTVIDKNLATATVIKTRQARKLGIKGNKFSDSDSEQEEEEPQTNRSGAGNSGHKDHQAIYNKLINLGGEEDDSLSQGSQKSQRRINFKRSLSRKASSESNTVPPSQAKTPNNEKSSNWSKLQQAARAMNFKKSLTQFTPSNLVKNMAQYALRADIQERAEFEESSPLTKMHLKNKQFKRSQFQQGLVIKMEKFQFDEAT